MKCNLQEAYKILNDLSKKTAVLNNNKLYNMVQKAANTLLNETIPAGKELKLSIENKVTPKTKVTIGNKLEEINKQLESDMEPGLLEKLKTKKAILHRWIRSKIEETIPHILKENKKETNSISALLGMYGTDLKKLMSVMPRIIKESPEGEAMLTRALETLAKFTDDRAKVVIPVQEGSGEENLNPLLKSYTGNKIAQVINSTDPEIQKVVKRAMNIASIIIYGEMNNARTLNYEQMTDYLNGAFASLIPTGEQSLPTPLLKKLTAMIKKGQIVPEATYHDAAGQRFLKELEAILNTSTITVQEKADITKALGALVVGNLIRPNTHMDGAERKVLATNPKTGELEIRDITAAVEGSVAIKVLDISGIDKTTVDSAASVFEFASEKDEGTISDKPIRVPFGKKVRNGVTKISKKAAEYLTKQSSNALKFSDDFAQIWEEADKDVNKLKKFILGDLDTILEDASVMDAESIIAKYEADELDIERMIMAYELVGNNEFYVGWDYTKSGRNMIANKLVNIQNSKISRFIIGYKGMKHTLTKKDGKYNKKDIHHVKVGLAQAFDIGSIDKTSDEKAFKDLEEIILITEEGAEFINSPKGRAFKKMVDTGTLAAIRQIKPDISTSEIMHVYQGLQLVKRLAAKEDNIETNLAMEVDGITNGMITMLLQMGWSLFTKGHLQRGGVYDKTSGLKNHGEYKTRTEGDTNDIYQAPIPVLTERFKPETTDLINKIVGTNWRNFMKDPVMLFIYGASLKNITAAVARSLIVGNSYIKGGLSDGKIADVANLAGMTLEQLEKTGMLEYKKYDRKTGKYVVGEKGNPKHAYLSEFAIQKLAKEIDKKIGGVIASGFESTFSEIIDFRRTLKTVEQMNYLIFRSEFDKKVKALKKNNLGELTSDELDIIFEKMQKEGTYYSANNASGSQQDYIKYGSKAGTEAQTIRVAVPMHKFQGNGAKKINATELNQQIKEFIANVGAVGVVTVHDIDGTTMIEGHTDAVLNIYDALMMGVNSDANSKQIIGMNKAYFNINTRHSILGRATKKLLKNIDMLDPEFITPEMANDFIKDFKRITETPTKESLDPEALLDMVRDTLTKTHESRKALGEQDLIINQYYVTDDVPGYEAKAGTEVEGVFNSWESEVVAEELNKVMDGLNKVLQQSLHPKKVEAKTDSGIINKEEGAETAKDKAQKNKDKIMKKGCKWLV